MVTVIVNYEIVMKEYEKEAQIFIDTLKNSNSKYKNTEVEKIKWMYSFSYFKNKGEYTQEYYENLYHMKFEDRLEEELSKVRVNLSMSAGHFYISDRISGISDSIKEAVKIITIQKMINEQDQIQDQEVIDTIPVPKEEQVPMSLEDQLKQAIDEEDYIKAAEIRDKIKKQNEDIYVN